MSDAHDRAIAGVSGGRTSAEMAIRLRDAKCAGLLGNVDLRFSFQNTSREHSKTYDFIDRLEAYLGEPIVRLEFRAPARGEPPKMATFEIVEHRHLARDGSVFRDMLECLKTYRAKHKGAGPIAPWAQSRICTAYLKVRTQRKFCVSLGWADVGQHRHLEYAEHVGLRADEPDRVSKMRLRNQNLDTDERAILADAGMSKVDVLRAWAARPFDLGLSWDEEHLGNCVDCFLKDERDLARAMIDPEGDPDWWIGIERDFGPMRRGGRPSYAQVLAEAPERMKIAKMLGEGAPYEVIAEASTLSPRRVKLIVAQELAPRQSFSCECDAAKGDEFDDMIEAA